MNWGDNFLNNFCFGLNFFLRFFFRGLNHRLFDNGLLNWGLNFGNNLFRFLLLTFFLFWRLWLDRFFGDNFLGGGHFNLHLLGWLFGNNWSVFLFRWFWLDLFLDDFFLFNLLFFGCFGSNNGNWAVWFFFRVLRYYKKLLE